MRYRAERVETCGLEEIRELDHLNESRKTQLRSLDRQRLALSAEVAALEERWQIFKTLAPQEQRRRVIGARFKTLQLVSGRKFEDVSVSAIDDAGVTIRHADGSARLRFSDLNFEQRAYFGLEASLAQNAEEKEMREAIAYERGIESQMAIIRQQEIAESEQVRREETVTAERQRSLQLAAQRVAAAKVSPLSQPATRFGSRYWTHSNYGSSYRSHRPVYRYVYYNTQNVNANFRAAAARKNSFCPAVAPKR